VRVKNEIELGVEYMMNRAMGILILLCGGCSDGPVREAEPTYQGKSLEYWVQALGDRDARTREQGTVACAEIGPKAKRAIPKLLERLGDADLPVRMGAARALGRIGPDAVPMLVGVLGQSTPRKQNAGPTDLQPLVHDVAYTKQKHAIEAAAIAVGLVGKQAGAAIGSLVSALEDEDAGVRLRAAEALGKIGKPAEQALPALRKLEKEGEDDGVKNAASEAVNRISSEN
jgi:HEAT repeat protein